MARREHQTDHQWPHRSLLATGADKAKEAAGDAQASADAGAPKGYVATARDAAANALQQVEGYVHRLSPMIVATVSSSFPSV